MKRDGRGLKTEIEIFQKSNAVRGLPPAPVCPPPGPPPWPIEPLQPPPDSTNGQMACSRSSSSHSARSFVSAVGSSCETAEPTPSVVTDVQDVTGKRSASIPPIAKVAEPCNCDAAEVRKKTPQAQAKRHEAKEVKEVKAKPKAPKQVQPPKSKTKGGGFRRKDCKADPGESLDDALLLARPKFTFPFRAFGAAVMAVACMLLCCFFAFSGRNAELVAPDLQPNAAVLPSVIRPPPAASNDQVWTGVRPKESGSLGERRVGAVLQSLNVEGARALAVAKRPAQKGPQTFGRRPKRSDRDRLRYPPTPQEIRDYFESLSAFLGSSHGFPPASAYDAGYDELDYRRRYAALVDAMSSYADLSPHEARAALNAELQMLASLQHGRGYYN